jgi:hypothetical protein
MTHNQPDLVRDSNGGVQRRTLVAGAAWTIPVVATAVGAPLAAASGEAPTLAFTNGPYTVAACGTLKDVVIKATTDGTTAPPAGTLVTVTLPAGLTWSNGETGSRPFSTDANGEVVLSGVKASGTAATVTIAASTSSATAAAPVTVSAAGNAWAYVHETNSAASMGGNRSGVVGNGYFLDSEGNLYYYENPNPVATGVASAVGYLDAANNHYVDYVKTDGSSFAYRAEDNNTASFGGDRSTAVGNGYFLSPDGGLYYYENPNPVATGVTSAFGYLDTANNHYVDYIDSTGNAFGYRVEDNNTASFGGPRSKAVGNGYFLSPDGALYYYENPNPVATGVTSAIGYMDSANNHYVDYVDSTGNSFTYRVEDNSTASHGGDRSTAVGVGYFLSPDGGLYYYNEPNPIATGVTAAVGYIDAGNNHYVDYVTAPVC